MLNIYHFGHFWEMGNENDPIMNMAPRIFAKTHILCVCVNATLNIRFIVMKVTPSCRKTVILCVY